METNISTLSIWLVFQWTPYTLNVNTSVTIMPWSRAPQLGHRPVYWQDVHEPVNLSLACLVTTAAPKPGTWGLKWLWSCQSCPLYLSLPHYRPSSRENNAWSFFTRLAVLGQQGFSLLLIIKGQLKKELLLDRNTRTIWAWSACVEVVWVVLSFSLSHFSEHIP